MAGNMHQFVEVVLAIIPDCTLISKSQVWGTKLPFFFKSHLAPKYSKVVFNSKQIVASLKKNGFILLF